MNKIIHLFKKFLLIKKSYRKPNKKPILIFDSMNNLIVKEFFGNDSIEILDNRGETLNIPIFLKSIFSPVNLRQAYIDNYIRAVKPKFIITLIDNSLEFYQLKSRHPNLTTIIIQNGVRSYHHDIFHNLDNLNKKIKRQLNVDFILCFGKIIGEHYKKYLSGKVIPVGSIRNNKISKKEQKKIKNSLTFISQWLESDHLGLECDHSVVTFLRQYSIETNKDLRIIPRNKKNSLARKKEDLFYKSIFEKDIPYFEQENLSSYELCDLSEVTIGIDSTLCYENLARGNKTAIFSVRSDILKLSGFEFNWPAKLPDHGLFWTNKYSEGKFSEILDRLYDINNNEWQNNLNNIKYNDSFIYDNNNLVLKKFISEKIKKNK